MRDGSGVIWSQLRLDELDKFSELRRVCGSLDVILGFLKTLNLFISSDGQEDVERLYGRLNQFRAAYNDPKEWGKMTLMLVRKHLDELKCIDSRLMDLDPIFLSGIVSAQKLLFWLRDSLPDDDEFENRIQVAMGTWYITFLIHLLRGLTRVTYTTNK